MQPKKFSEYTPITNTDGSEVIPILKAGVNATVKSEDLPISTATQTAIDAADADIAAHIADVANPHEVTKTQVGLGNADNTSDANKPVSTAQATAIALKADQATTYTKTEVDTKDTAVADTAQTNLTTHASNTSNPHATTKAQVGLANADNTSDVDKPISAATQTALDAKATNTALDAHTNNTSNPHSVTKAQVGLGNADNTSDINKPVSTAMQSVLNAKAPTASPSFTGTVTVAGDVKSTAGGAVGSGAQPLASNLYIQSRLQNLVTNGSGLLGNNYNFSGFSFDSVETHGGGGSFAKYGSATILSDELIPVDPERSYREVAWVKSGNTGGTEYAPTNKQYFGVALYDIDGLAMSTYHTMIYAGSSDTTLAADLNNGDTTITLTNATGWNNAGAYHERQIRWYGYTNSNGYTYPDYTYSRNTTSSAAIFPAYNVQGGSLGAWAAGGISGNVITLTSPWTGGHIAAGTAVSNSSDGPTYKYITIYGVTVPNAWTRYEGYIGTLDTARSNSFTKFPYGTAYVKLLYLANHSSGDTANRIRYSDVWFSEMSSRNLEEASATVPGVVSTGTQAWAGAKTLAGNFTSATDSTYTLGTSSLYWSNTYTDRLYLNSTAYLDGATAGEVTTTGVLTVAGGAEPQFNLSSNSGGQIFRAFARDSDNTFGLYDVSNAGTFFRFAGHATPGSRTMTLLESGGNLGIGTTAPTHTLTLPSTSTGIALYNTSDQTTNYERLRLFTSSSTYRLFAEQGGTGQAREIIISALGGITQALALNVTSANGFVESRGASGTASAIIHRISGALSASSSTQYGLSVVPTFSQTSTAGYTALLINPTETTTGSGAKNLIDAQVNGVSLFRVDNAGQVNTASNLRAGGWIGATGITPTAAFDAPGSATTRASVRIRSGVAPTTPNDGDIWYDGTDLKMRVGGTTKTFTLV